MTKEDAIKLYKNKIYKKMSFYKRVKFQLFEERLCMPFEIFQEAVEKTLGRSVLTHEFGFNVKGLQEEFNKIKDVR